MPKIVKRVVLPGLVLIIAVAVFAATQLGGGRTIPETPGIVALVPGPGDKVLMQNKVGVVVSPEYGANLEVNGVDIPAGQIEAPLNPGELLFQPGPGKVLRSLEPENNCVTARVWLLVEGPERASVRTWCFRAS
jgi:hypothetical protein